MYHQPPSGKMWNVHHKQVAVKRFDRTKEYCGEETDVGLHSIHRSNPTADEDSSYKVFNDRDLVKFYQSAKIKLPLQSKIMD